MAVPETATSLFVRLLQRAKPVRRLSLWARYGLTILLVLTCFQLRYALEGIYPFPYLLFLPGILVASFVFDRGSGFLATFLSAALALYFFVEPWRSFGAENVGSLLSAVVFTVMGLLTAGIIEALRSSVDELADTNEELEATNRRLDESRREVRQSLNILQSVIEGSPDPIFVKDREGRFVSVNSVLARIIGAPVEAITGRKDSDFFPPDVAQNIESVDRVVLDTRSALAVEEKIVVAGKGPRWFLSTKAPWYGPDGTLQGIIGISRDIDERKQAEAELRAANQQKVILLEDINHRVKNHLQSVIATLSMSGRRLHQGKEKDTIAEAINRLRVLSRVYDRLEIKAGGEALVGTRTFIQSLTDDLAPALLDLRPIALRLFIANETLELGRAVSVGLIINEALTNAVKYAFPEERSGIISISFQRLGSAFRLEITDDGIGRSGSLSKGGGQGSCLIRALAQQLGGAVEWQGPPGTRVILNFPARHSLTR